MKALLWKRINEFKKNKTKLLFFLLSPILYLLILSLLKYNWNNIIAYFTLTFTTFSMIIHFSVEELISCEVFLATNISIKKLWLTNILFVSLVGFIYSSFILTIGFLISFFILEITMHITIYVVIQCAFNILPIIAIVAASTIHFADYSKIKQITASVFSLIGIASPFIFLGIGKNLTVSSKTLSILTIIPFIIFLISYYIINTTNKEKLIINTQTIAKSYQNKIIEE
jgi:hypothetical protein